MSQSRIAPRQRPSDRFLLSDGYWSVARDVPAYESTMRPADPPVIFGSAMLPTPTDDASVTLRVSEQTCERMREPLQRIEALVALGAGWDTYGSQPIRPAVALHAVRLLAAILSDDVPTPSIVPTSTGGLQLEWHQRGADLELEVSPDKSVIVFLQMPTEQTWEGPLANSQWALRRFLSYVSSED